MKTKFIIELNTPDEYNVTPEDWDESTPQSEKAEYHKEFAERVHKLVVENVEWYFEDNLGLEDNFMDDLETDLYVDGWDEMADYDIDIKVTKE